ncbi:cytochrome-c peroxidase [Kaarinaea lacus]
MLYRKVIRNILALGALCLGTACLVVSAADSNAPLSSTYSPIYTTRLKHEPIQPIPLHVRYDTAAAKLGKKLFNDRRLEKRGRLACGDCHNLEHGGADARIQPVNINGNAGKLNTPTILNVSFNAHYYWNAKFTSLDQQIDDALYELDITWKQLVRKLQNVPEYVLEFKRLFMDGITIDNIRHAFIAYEKSLVTPNSRFDRYLRGDGNILTTKEKKGYELFKTYGCVACHQGINVGGNLVLNENEIYNDKIPTHTINIPADNNGLRLIPEAQTRIRVPSLRNVALTAPYFHDGSVASLELAVAKMSSDQLGISMPYRDIKLIALFLQTLTGELNGKPL